MPLRPTASEAAEVLALRYDRWHQDREAEVVHAVSMRDLAGADALLARMRETDDRWTDVYAGLTGAASLYDADGEVWRAAWEQARDRALAFLAEIGAPP